jgi:hypothetical protein
MMYNNKLVAVIKTGGRVLREHGNVVLVPFGCEFSILLKNLNTVRADVRVSIDGDDVLNGSSLIIDAGGSIELERYIKELDRGNRFKFIERSSSVENHRGIGAEDGLIRIEYQFERQISLSLFRGMQSGGFGSITADGRYYKGGYNPDTQPVFYAQATYSAQSMTNSVVPAASLSNDVGITVPGSISDQKFQTVAALNLEAETSVMVIQLKGETESNKKIVNPVTVAVKPKCQTCGKVNKATAKFCTECGTSLAIV